MWGLGAEFGGFGVGIVKLKFVSETTADGEMNGWEGETAV